MATHDVLVRGAGPVGLAAALALARQGLDVALLGRDETRADDIRAYALNPASAALLQMLKVWDALPADARTAVHDMRVEGDAAGAAIEFSAWTQQVDALAWIVDAAALQAALDGAVRYAPNVQRVPAPVDATLVVLAEGRDSDARAALGVAMDTVPYAQHAVAARLEASNSHGGRARQWFRSPDVLALLPMDRPRAGHGYALVWSLPDDRAAALMAASDADVETALADATGAAAGPLTLASARVAFPVAVGRADRVAGAGWALVGDAAHVVHPLAGQGLNLGLADVAALADTVAARERWRGIGDERLLARYARARALPTRAFAAVTDGLLRLFASEAPLVRELRNRGLGLADGLSPLKRFLTARALES